MENDSRDTQETCRSKAIAELNRRRALSSYYSEAYLRGYKLGVETALRLAEIYQDLSELMSAIDSCVYNALVPLSPLVVATERDIGKADALYTVKKILKNEHKAKAEGRGGPASG